jgi:cysteine synthase
MSTRYDNILDTVGSTPIVRINKLGPSHVNLFAKLESFNPMGSVKDRLALAIIEDAERNGRLRPGQTVIEATSGNTGIGLAMVCAQKGYPLVVVMAEQFSVERRRLMRFLGARVVLTPASLKGSGMIAKARELAIKHNWFLCEQFENEANAAAHARTTAPEILEAFEGERLDYFVTGTGTGGTLKGVASVLRAQRPNTKIIVCEPDNAPMLASGIRQPQSNGDALVSHPSFRPHVMQGWSPDLIPKLTQDALDSSYHDRILPISGDDALRLSRELATKEGIFVGISSGATLAGALQIAKEAAPGSNILCMLPDTGERYLSTPLFANVETEMNGEELEISRSTPSARFDSSPAPAAPSALTPIAAPRVEINAAHFVEEVINDAKQPVVLFALEWCEFCWSVRRMFARCGIPFRSIDIDSVAYQPNDRGGKIRAALSARTGMQTIPQIFVGGQFIGGCTELFDAWRQGKLHALLDQLDIKCDVESIKDPSEFLPTWLHSRTTAPNPA